MSRSVEEWARAHAATVAPRLPRGAPDAAPVAPDVRNWRLDRTIGGDGYHVFALHRADDGRLLLARAAGRQVEVLELAGGVVPVVAVSVEFGVQALHWTPRGGPDRLVCCCGDGTSWLMTLDPSVAPSPISRSDETFSGEAALVRRGGDTLLMVEDGNAVAVIDIEERREIARLAGRSVPVWGVAAALDPAGRMLVANLGHTRLAVYEGFDSLIVEHPTRASDLLSHSHVRFLRDHGHDATLLAVLSGGALDVLDISSGRTVLNIDGLGGALAVSPGPRAILAVVDEPGRIVRVHACDGELLAELPVASEVSTLDLDELPDGRLVLMAGCADGTAFVWTTAQASQPVVRAPELDFVPTSSNFGADTASVVLAARPNDTVLAAVGYESGLVRVWDTGSGECLHELALRSSDVYNPVFGLAWVPGSAGQRLAVGTLSGFAELWDLTADPPTAVDLGRFPYQLSAVDCAPGPDGRTLVAVDGGRRAVLIDDTGAELFSFDQRPYRQALSLCVNKRATFLAVGSLDSRFAVYSITHDGVVASVVVQETERPVRLSSFAVADDDTPLIAVGWQDGRIEVWDAGRGERIRQLHGHSDRMLCGAWARLSDGRLILVSGSGDGAVRLWDPLHSTDCVGTIPIGSAVESVDLAPQPDGRLLLAADASEGVRLMVTSLPVVEPTAQPTGPWSVGPLVDVTPAEIGGTGDSANGVTLTRTGDGCTLLAAGGGDYSGESGPLRGSGWAAVWDVDTGEPIAQFRAASLIPRHLVFAPEGRTRLAIAGFSAAPGLWDLSDQLPTEVEYAGRDVADLAWASTPNGSRLLVTADENGRLEIRNDVTGIPMRSNFAANGGSTVRTMDATPDEAGALRISIAGIVSVQQWNADDLAPIAELAWSVRPAPGGVYAIRGTRVPDGRSLLAAGGDASTTHVWNVASGELLYQLSQSASLLGLAWLVLTDARVLLATGCFDGRVDLWNGLTGAHLRTVDPPRPGWLRDVALHQDPDGRVRLAAAGEWGVRVYDVPVVPRPQVAVAPADPVVAPPLTALVALGAAGRWLPLGLLADLVTLTGPTGADPEVPLADPRLRVLASVPGVALLRGLGWAEPARAALAALLAARTLPDVAFAAPDGTRPAQQRVALETALRQPSPHRPGPVDPAALRAAADDVTARTVALLDIIGQSAATLDPLLPLRLARHAAALPALTRAQQRLLGNRDGSAPRAAAASPLRAPGSVGVTRSGPLTSVLLTEHALPAEIFRMRLAGAQLLHRNHPAMATPRARPVTLVLDTTPPTFGAPEALLRTVAHVVTRNLWAAGEHPLLVTLDAPRRAREVRTVEDLLAVWSGRTLRASDLAAGLRTATAAAAHPTVALTTHRGAAGHPVPSGRHQLVTTHQPGFPPATVPGSAHRHHLAPDADETVIAATVAALLETAHAWRAS